jgi:hypothetical protein
MGGNIHVEVHCLRWAVNPDSKKSFAESKVLPQVKKASLI